jgi:hypothetical protein
MVSANLINNNAKKSSYWLWLVLLATIALTAWTAINSNTQDTDNTAELVSLRKPESATEYTKNNIDNRASSIKLQSNESIVTDSKLIPWDKLKRDIVNTTPKDLFSAHSWVIIPPAPKIKLEPPPPPAAPPSPFTYFGKMEDGPKGTLVFLIANNKVYSVRKGEKIDAFWRFDSEDANNIRLTYLPLNLPQVLSKNQKTSAPLEANKPAEIN